MEVLDRQSASQVNWDLKGNFLLNQVSRQHALDFLENSDFPTTRTEAWKYTRVAKIKNASFSNATEHSLSGDFGLSESSVKYVFVNGLFAPELSSSDYPDGTKILALSAMDTAEQQVIGMG